MDLFNDEPPTEAERDATYRTCADVLEHLSTGMDIENVVRLVSLLHSNSDEWIATLRRRHPQDARQIACKKGCAWCCHMPVDASVLEIIRLVEYVKAQFTPDGLAALRQRVAEAHEKTVHLTAAERAKARVPCPLLGADGVCTVYEVRPLTCRRWNATNAQSCKKAHFHPGRRVVIYQFAEQLRLGIAMQAGIVKAMEESGFQHGYASLIPTLHILLNDPSAADAWLSGRDVLQSALG